MRTLRIRILIPLLGCAALAAGCAGGTNVATTDIDLREAAATGPDFDLVDGRTDKPVQVDALAGSGYTVEPLVTSADQIPLYKGSFPSDSVNKKLSYGFPGTPDGIGVTKHGGHYFAFVNHEFVPGNFSNYGATFSGQINGARVSLLVFDDHWKLKGGRTAIERVYDGSTLIGVIDVDTDSRTVSQLGTVFSRFCSGGLSEIYGEPLYFCGEEVANGRAFTIDTNGNARLIRDCVRIDYENVIPISKYAGQTVAIADDDGSPGANNPNGAFLVLYVGDRSQGNHGFNAGTSYAGRVFINGTPVSSSAALVQGTSYTVQWVAVPRTYDFDGAGPNPAVDLYGSTSNFYKWANLQGCTGFMRPEDGTENPAVPGELHFVTTGRIGSYEQYGRIWQLNLGANPTADGTIRGNATGSTSTFMNPDNVAADTFGKLWMDEDPSGTQDLMLAAGRVASVWRSDLGSSTLTRLFELNQDKAPFNSMGIANFHTDPWETSGIVQVGERNGDAEVLFDTQGHGWFPPGYVEGGQLLYAYPTADAKHQPKPKDDHHGPGGGGDDEGDA